MDNRAEQRWWFDLISSLWREREREKEKFVSRQELHDELFQRIPAADGEVLTELVHGGIDLALDAFAFFGYNEKAFSERLNGDADQLPAKSGLFWRYKVTRRWIVGYVRPEHLTEFERERSYRSTRRLK